MRIFRNLPIKWKLMLAMLTASLIALLLLGSLLFFTRLPHLRNLAVQEAAALAEMIGRNCAGGLEAGNAKATQEALNEIATTSTIEEACLHTADGQLLARYTRRNVTPEPFPSCKTGESFAGNRLMLCRPIKHRDRMVGTICLRMDTGILRAQLKDYLGMGFLVMGISMLVALVFANRLQRLFSGPILELARVAHAVAQQKDFSQRAAKLSEDECGALTDAFNRMLITIQEHDSGSRASQSRLEARVAERTVELQKVNESLRESEERLRAVFEQAMDGIMVGDVDTMRFSLSNPQMCRMLGYTVDEVQNLTLADIHPKDDLPWITKTFARMAAEEISLAPEIPIRRKDGSVFYADISARPMTIGGRRCILGIFRDTTERKRAKETLQRRLEIEHFVASVSNRFANTSLPKMDAAIQEVLAGLGRVTQADRCYLFNVSDDLAIADNTHEWCAPGVRSQIDGLRDVPATAFPWYLKQLRGGEPLLLSRIADLPAEAGAERRLLQSASVQSVILVPISHADKLVGFIGCDAVRAERDWSDENTRLLRTIGELIIDTQARLQTGEALREREERLQAVLENSLDVAYRRDLQTDRYDFFSPAVEKVTGYTPQELIGKSLDCVLGQVHPDDLMAAKHVLKQAQTGEVASGIVEYRFRHKDGSYRWLSDRFTVVKNADGRPLYWVGVSRDATEQKRMEEALLESEDRYRSLFATSMDAVLLGTTDGRILAANAAACRMFGLTEEELIKIGRDRITDLSDPRLQAATKERERTGVFYGELTFIRSDGTKFPAEVSSVVFRVQKGDTRASMVIRDITDRKRAEEALRTLNETLEQRVAERTALADQRTQEMREAQHVAHVSNWIWNVETGNLTWSEELFRICGLDPKRHAPNVQEHQRILTPESFTRWHAATEQTLRTGAPHEVDLELIRPDGGRRWINVHGEVMVRNGDRVTSLRGTAQDITERKQAEEALRASEEKFRRIAGHIQDVLYSVDMETNEFRYLSPVFERIFGYSLEDIQNMGGRTAFLKKVIERSAVSLDDHRRRLERLKTQPKDVITIRDEEWWRCKDGTLKCVEDRWLPVYEAGRLTGTDGVLCDITERRRAEEALRESEERYRSLVNNLNVGVYRNTPDGRYLQANPALVRMHGYDSVDEFLKTNVVDFYENSVDRAAFLAHLFHADAVTGYEVRLKIKNGTRIYCAITAAVHHGPDGRVEWIDGIVEDITERKRLEDQLLEISEREQRRIGQDLHDGLCQHLAGVSFMSKALAQKLAASSPAESADAQAVANLIRQAISEARGIAAGLHPVKKEANSAMVALQGLADNLKSMFRVQCVFVCDPPVLIEDNTAATHLYRIAQEAVNNAIRHGKAKQVWIALAETDHQIKLTVKDDGKGISLPLSAARGIGMDIMNHRARVIGGTLNIDRAPEGGTVLTCSFPKKNAA